MKGSETILSIEEIKKRLTPLFQDAELQLALLFGSVVAKRMNKKRSDIDLAFLFDRPVDILPLTNKVIRLLHSDNVDVVDLRRCSPLLKFSSVKNGKLLYERSPRLLQELIEAAIDINIHIIIQTGHTAPDDYYKSFIRAGEIKIISSDLAKKLVPSAGLRNRLMHEYDQLEHSMVLDAVKTAEDLYSQYVKEINDYISRLI